MSILLMIIIYYICNMTLCVVKYTEVKGSEYRSKPVIFIVFGECIGKGEMLWKS